MTSERVDFRTALAAETTEAAAADGGHHPDLETWTAYVERRLGPEEEERLQEHLVACRRCVDEVRELAEFHHAGRGAPQEAADPARVDRLVRGVRERAAATEREAAEREAAAPRRRPPPLLLAAAICLLLLAGMVAWTIHTQGRVAELEERLAAATRPSVQVAIHDLYPPSTLRQGEGEAGEAETGEAETVRLAPGWRATWVLHLPAGSDADAYRVELVDSEGRPAMPPQQARPELHTLLLDVPVGALPAGRYTVRVSTADGSRVADYPVEVRAP